MTTDYLKKVSSNGGRPKLILTDNGCKAIRQLAGMMCTDEEIAAVLETTVDTLTNKNNKKAFSENKKIGIETGKASLRRRMFKLSEKSVPMCIFLSKNFLMLSDNPETSNDQEDTDSYFEEAGLDDF